MAHFCLTRRQLAVILGIIGLAGLLVRLSHVHPDLVIRNDELLYFQYAMDVARMDSLPSDYTPFNNGWPIFLSLFFQFVDSGNYFDYMLVQRVVGVALSIITIVPIYVVCRRFVSQKMALVGPVIFAFEPAVVHNSVLGLTEPLFVLLVAAMLACFLSPKPAVFFTFPLIALAAMVRGEMVIMLVPFVMLYIIRFRHSRRTAYEVPLLVLMVVLILTPMIAYRVEILGTDAMFVRAWDRVGDQIDRLQAGPGVAAQGQGPSLDSVFSGLRGLVGFTDVLLVPLVFLIPYGLYRIFGAEMRRVQVVTILFFMLAITINALSLTGAVPRYFFWMIPILCILCAISVERLTGLFANRDAALIVIMGMIVASSMVVSEGYRLNAQYVSDAREIMDVIFKIDEGNSWNAYEAFYIDSGIRMNLTEFPVISRGADIWGLRTQYCGSLYPSECASVTDHEDRIAEILKKIHDRQFTHVVVDGLEKRHDYILIHIFQNEDRYPYLTKVYDSRDDGLEYHVKVFEIDQDALRSLYPD